MKQTGIFRATLCASVVAAMLAACGGGGGGSASTSASSAVANTMTGTVAMGNALVGASVTVTDANGKTATATSDTNGTYNVSISGLSAPFIITAVDPSGASNTLYSVVASQTSANGVSVTANVTPLTTAVTALLTADGNPLSLTKSGALTAVTPSAVSSAVTVLDTALASILSANGLSAASFDPIGASFTPNQSGADAVIDSVSVTPSATGTGLQLASLADPNTSITLKNGATVPAPLKVAPQAANYLSQLLAQLGQCVSGTSSACASAIDASYLNDGYTTMPRRHTGLFGKGSTVIGVKTVAFLPANTLPAITNSAALVYFLYTDANGKPNFASDVVQQLPNKSWDIIGNQAQFDAYIASFVGRVQFTDAADANNARLESGLQIEIPSRLYVSNPASVDPAVSSTPSLVATDGSLGVGSALVQGPGLPGNGLYMMSAGAGFGPWLTIPATALSAPCNPCSGASAPNGGMSTQYKLTWASLTGGSTSWSPNGAADYAPQPVDLSTLSQFAAYTITFYDYLGNQIGQPEKILNVARTMSAASGASVPWQTLGSDVIANLLTQGGSGTAVRGNASTTLDWTVPASGLVYPNFWASIDSISQPIVSGGTQTYPAQPYDADYYGVPTVTGTTYSETFPAGFVDSITATAAASAEKSALVRLNWQADGDYYSNTWQYNN